MITVAREGFTTFIVFLQEFGDCLKHTDEFLHKLLSKGAATLEQLGMSELPEGPSHIDRDGIDPIVQFPTYSDYKEKSATRIQEVKDAFELRLYVPRAKVR